MKTIAFVGKAGVGKDTAGSQLALHYGFATYAMAGPLKAMLFTGLGLDPKDFVTSEQKEATIERYGFTYREAAQTLGTEWGRALNDDLWLISAGAKLDYAASIGVRGIAITDVRFENEADWVRERGGQIVHIVSELTREGMSDKAKAHVSESGVGVLKEDLILYNYGTLPEFKLSIDSMMSNLGLGRV